MHSRLIDHIDTIVSLSGEEAEIVQTCFRPVTLRKKHDLFRQGETVKYEYFVVKGCLKTFSVDESGNEHILSFSVENWWAGDLYSFFTGVPSGYGIRALEDCELLRVDNESLELLYIKVPKMERYFRILLKNAFIASQRRIAGAIGQTAEERYLQFTGTYPNLEQRIPQYMLASYLGITAEFLSKIRRRLARR